MGRMWMVPVEMLCKHHLFGEHNGLHMFTGLINKKHKLDSYIKSNSLEVSAIQDRHTEVVAEILKRNYLHNTDLPTLDLEQLSSEIQQYHVDREASLKLLLLRCEECCNRHFKR